MGFRKNTQKNDLHETFIELKTGESLTADTPLDIFGPQYLVLSIDDYNKNHMNKTIITSATLKDNISLPNYYSAAAAGAGGGGGFASFDTLRRQQEEQQAAQAVARARLLHRCCHGLLGGACRAPCRGCVLPRSRERRARYHWHTGATHYVLAAQEPVARPQCGRCALDRCMQRRAADAAFGDRGRPAMRRGGYAELAVGPA